MVLMVVTSTSMMARKLDAVEIIVGVMAVTVEANGWRLRWWRGVPMTLHVRMVLMMVTSTSMMARKLEAVEFDVGDMEIQVVTGRWRFQ
jgi:hypothetical protein